MYQEFETFIRENKLRLYNYILKIVDYNESLADDLFQDTCLKMCMKISSGTYDNKGKMIQYAMRIAYNLCMDYYRANKKYQVVNVENINLFNLIIEKSENGVDFLNINNEISKHILELVDKLPVNQREVVIMRTYTNLRLDMIAKITQIKTNTVRGNIRYAYKNLRRMLREKQLM